MKHIFASLVLTTMFAASSLGGEVSWDSLGDPAAKRKPSFPQVDVPSEYRLKNFSDRPNDGNCLWVAIDPLLKKHGYDVSLSKYRWGGGTLGRAHSELTKREIKVVCRDHFSRKDMSLLRQSCEEGLGAVVTIRMGMEGHALECVGCDDTHVALIDNNDPKLAVRTVKIDEFSQKWDGGILAIMPKSYTGDMVKQCPGGQCPPSRGGQESYPGNPFPGGASETGAYLIKQSVPAGATVGDVLPQGKIVKIELRDGKRYVTIEPVDVVLVKPAVMPATIELPKEQTSPRLISSWEGLFGINRRYLWSDGTRVDYDFFGRRVYRP